MSLTIDLTPNEEAQLSEAAKHVGLAPAELAKKLLQEHLPGITTNEIDDLDAKLHAWQQQDGTQLMPDVPTQLLFAQWAAEDAQMTDAERQAEDHLWEDLEKGLAENSHVLQLRRLG